MKMRHSVFKLWFAIINLYEFNNTLDLIKETIFMYYNTTVPTQYYVS